MHFDAFWGAWGGVCAPFCSRVENVHFNAYWIGAGWNPSPDLLVGERGGTHPPFSCILTLFDHGHLDLDLLEGNVLDLDGLNGKAHVCTKTLIGRTAPVEGRSGIIK